MHIEFIARPMIYDGSQLSSLWTFRETGKCGDSIVAFRGPCRLTFAEMVDVADVLAQSPIYSPDMLHFIVEHFDRDLLKNVYRQRLLAAIIQQEMAQRGVQLWREGDDLYLGEKKLSISIATLTRVSAKIHMGLNIATTGVPVPAVGLEELGISTEEIPQLALTVAAAYAREMSDSYLACCKVRGVD